MGEARPLGILVAGPHAVEQVYGRELRQRVAVDRHPQAVSERMSSVWNHRSYRFGCKVTIFISKIRTAVTPLFRPLPI